MNKDLDILQREALDLLKELIATPSFSREEDPTAAIIGKFLGKKNIVHTRVGNNVYALNTEFDPARPSILLNSHHDTVRPNAQYSRDPFSPDMEGGRLYGLGSNDAGGALVSLISTFLFFHDDKNLAYNLVLAATAEEEISGTGGIELLLGHQVFIEQTGGVFTKSGSTNACAIVGEPTLMQMAVAERGLMVLDCISKGRAGHAARNEGENAITKAMNDIKWFTNYQFPKNSEMLGPNKMSVTVIETSNKAHNIVPAECHFVVDTRINELYSFEEVIAVIRENVNADVTPRSTRLRSTSIALDHPLVKAGTSLGLSYYGSPTTSDKALMPFPALKIGPGDSARSHTADEYIYIEEIKKGIELYIQLLKQVI